ncbi:MAG TPA: hypothetical protein VFH74_16930 [Gaiellales bacterium]|nr:hypothetical protein [Gaiellales bacterium]
MATMTAHDVPEVRESTRVHPTGWVVFASILLIIGGAINFVNGYTLLEHQSYFHSQLVYSNWTFWGWAFLIWGGLQLLAGILAWSGSTTGNMIGVGLCSFAAILWFFMIFAAPWSAFVGVALNLGVLFALTAGARPEEYY